MGLRGESSGLQGLGFRVLGFGFRAQGLGLRGEGLGLQGLGFRFKCRGLSLGFRVYPFNPEHQTHIKLRTLADLVSGIYPDLVVYSQWQCICFDLYLAFFWFDLRALTF